MEFQYDYQYSRVGYIMRTMIFYHFSKKKRKKTYKTYKYSNIQVSICIRSEYIAVSI